MEAVAYLDTHVVVWLFAEGNAVPLSARAKAVLREAGECRYSPAVRLELQLLQEIGRLRATPDEILDSLGRRFDLIECPSPFPAVARAAVRMSWTRDPFDRFIAAQAELNGAVLVSKDRAIRKNYRHAVW